MPEISGAISKSGSPEVSIESDLDLATEILARSEMSRHRTGDFRTPVISGSNSDSALPEVSAKVEKDLGAEKSQGSEISESQPEISGHRNFPGLFPVNNHHRSVLIFEQT